MATKKPTLINAGGLQIERGTTQEQFNQQNPNFQGGTGTFKVGGLDTVLPTFNGKKESPLPTSPITPGAQDQIVGGSDSIREDQQMVRSESERILNDLDAIGQLRQQTTQSSLKNLQDIMANTERLMSGEFNENEQDRIDRAGASAGAGFDAAIARAKESARQGTAKSTVFAGEKGGFLSTQYSGQAALESTQGDSFIGRGGELSRIKGALEQNIAQLEGEQARAIEAARNAVKESLVSGNRQKMQDAEGLAEMAGKAAEMREQALEKRIDIMNQQEQLAQNRVVFGQQQEDRQLDKLKEFAELGVSNIPAEFASDIEATYGQGFVEEYLTAQRLSTEQGNEIAAMDSITKILARVPPGESIQIGDATYRGFGKDNSGNKTHSEEDRQGNVTYVTTNPAGEIINVAQGGRIGKGSAPRGGSGGGSDAPTNQGGLSFEEWLGQKQQAENITFNTGDEKVLGELEAEYQQTVLQDTDVKFTNTESKKLLQAGLSGASKQEKLDFLFEKKDDDDEPSDLDLISEWINNQT